MSKTHGMAATLALALSGCINFQGQLEEFCARTGRCAKDSGMGGGSGGSAGGATGGGVGGGGGMMGGGSGGGGQDSGVDAGCTRQVCLVATGQVQATLWTVWGSGPNDVYMGGSALFYFDGGQVAQRSDNPSPGYTIFGLHGTAPNDVWLTGRASPDTFRFNGTDWRSKKTDAGAAGFGIYARSENEVFLISENLVFFYDGGTWDRAYGNALGDDFFDIASTPGAPLYAVANESVYRIENDFSVSVQTIPNLGGESLIAVSVTPTGRAWVVGSGGVVLRQVEDGGFERLIVDVTGNDSKLNGVWARSDHEAWMAGADGTVLQWRSDAGFSWRTPEIFANTSNLDRITWQDMWGSGRDVWVIGTTGIQYDGGIWARLRTQ